MINQLVTCVIINLPFFWSLVNDTFSNLKLIDFVIIGFIYGKKEVKQVVLINQRLEFCFFF